MKQMLSLIAFLITSASFAQTGWEKISLTEKVNISFPAKPVAAKPSAGQQSFIFKQADSTANYVVAVSDLAALMGIDAATLETEMDKQESWDDAKTAFMSSMGADAKLIKDEMTSIHHTKALKLIIEKKSTSGGSNTLTVLIFVNGTNSMNVIFVNRNGKAEKKNEQQFFDSIEIKA